MDKFTLAATAIAVAAALAGCGRHDDNAASTASTTSPSSSDSSTMASTSAAPTTSSTTDQASTNVASSGSSSSSADSSAGNSASSTATMGAGASGQTVYTTTCALCHAAGVTGAPKLGDKADWKPRIAQGKDTLYQHALAGFLGKKGQMPPKGGNATLPDADVKAAVDYMVDQGK
jgi:cytochrome c5